MSAETPAGEAGGSNGSADNARAEGIGTPTGFRRAELLRWIDLAYPADVSGRLHICSTDGWAGRSFARDEVDALVDYAEGLDRQGKQGIYLRATTLREGAARRGSAGDSVELIGFWSDIDITGPGHKHDPAAHDGRELLPDEDSAHKIVDAAELPEPSAWVHSGGGLYAWWLLDKPVSDLTGVAKTSERIQAALSAGAASLGYHYGAGVGDLARVLRLPGTVNRKAGGAALCRIISDDGPRYALDDLTAIVDPLRAPDAALSGNPFAAPGRTRTSPLDDYEARTDWAEILTPAGWTFDHADPDGTSYWLRPGKKAGEGHSATTGRGKDRDRMWNFSTEAGLPVGESMTKPFVYAALHHGGDMPAAAAQLRADGYGPAAPKALTTLGEEFWTARPSLQHIRRAAHARGRSADVVLVASLARLSAMCSPDLRFDTGLGYGSLNLFAAVIGKSGTGKSAGCAVARDLIDAPSYLADPNLFKDGAGVGSGEGLTEVFMGYKSNPTGKTYKSGDRKGEQKTEKVRTQVRRNVFFYVDEGQALTAQVGRTGATIGPALRSAWGGELLGQANARDETTRHLAAGTYALGLLIGFQRSTAQPLLADAAAGTPQRLLWASAYDPSVPDTAPSHPGKLAVKLDRDSDGPLASPAPLTGTITFAVEIRAELWAKNLQRVRGEVEDEDDLDSHVSLMTSKVAALLALLDGRREVTSEDWRLAGMIWATSCAVRAELIAFGIEDARKAGEARTTAYVEREERAEVARSQAGSKVERIATQLTRKVLTDGPLTVGAARRSVAGRDRALFTEALEHATAVGWLRADDKTVAPGTSKPADL